MRTLIFILMFLIICGLVIANNNNLYFSQKEDLKTFGKLYLGWAEQVFQNARTLTGNVIEMDWLPKAEITNKTISKV